MKKTLFIIAIALLIIQVSLGQIIISSTYYVNTNVYDTIRGDLITGSVTYNPDTRTLTLEDATIFERAPDVDNMETTDGPLYFGGTSDNIRLDTLNIKLLGYNVIVPYYPVGNGITATYCTQINIIGPGSLVVGGVPAINLNYVQDLTVQGGANVRFPQPSATGFIYHGVSSHYERTPVHVDSSTVICETGIPFWNIADLQLSRCHIGFPGNAYFDETTGTVLNADGTNINGFFSIIPGSGTAVPQYLDDKVEISVWPNPAKEVINVQCTMNNVQLGGGIQIVDVYGKVVVETFHETSLQARIDVSGLAAGMYFVRVTTETGVVTKQFVKR